MTISDRHASKDLKYELTHHMFEIPSELPTIKSTTLHRIRALKDIPQWGVRKGEIGGYVESEANLSHEGNCWIGVNSKVYGAAKVAGGAYVGGHAVIDGDSLISGSAQITGYSKVSDSTVLQTAQVMGHAVIKDGSHVQGHCVVKDKAVVAHGARLDGMSKVMGQGAIIGQVQLLESATVSDLATVERERGAGQVILSGSTQVRDNASIKGTSLRGRIQLEDYALIEGQAVVRGHVQMRENSKALDRSYIDGGDDVLGVILSGMTTIGGNVRIEPNS